MQYSYNNSIFYCFFTFFLLLIGYFGPDGSNILIDKAELSIEGPQLLYSLRKQARVAALFALMAAASANGGSIGGNSIANDVQGQGNEQNDIAPRAVARPEAVAAGLPPARCVSPEPLDLEAAETLSCAPQASNRENERQESTRSLYVQSNDTKRRRFHP